MNFVEASDNRPFVTPITVNSQLSSIQAAILFIQPPNIFKEICHFIKLFQNNFVMCKQSLNMRQFSQSPLPALPIILHHTGAMTLKASRICNHVTVYVSQIFHLPTCYVAQGSSDIRTKTKQCGFDFIPGFYKRFSCK